MLVVSLCSPNVFPSSWGACWKASGDLDILLQNIQIEQFQWSALSLHVKDYLALINLAGGLYERILTEVVSTNRTQWGLYTRSRSRFSHTDRLGSVNKMFITWQKQEQFISFKCNWFVLTDISLPNGEEPNFILPNFARPLCFFFSSAFCHLQK